MTRERKAMVSKMTSSKASLLALVAALSTSSAGCTQTPKCEELGDCGGEAPLGAWVLGAGHPSCQEDLYAVTKDPRLFAGEVPAARQPPIEPAAWDWCYLLVTSGGPKIQLKQPTFFYESGPIGRATLSYSGNPYDGNGTYTLGLAYTGTYFMDFPAICMREFGAMDNRPANDETGMPVGGPVGVCQQLQPYVAAAGIGEGSYPNVSCGVMPDDALGCRCYFEVSETGGSAGTYRVQGNTIVHWADKQFSMHADFCNKGDSLQLTGHDGSYLFNVPSLRTMDLAKGMATP
jgi:hypothetical protein